LKRSRKAEDVTKGREDKGKYRNRVKMNGRNRREKKQKIKDMRRERRKLNITVVIY
jgi:hypothetical protein